MLICGKYKFIVNCIKALYTVLMACKIVVCGKSHSLNERGVWGRSVICNSLSVAFVSVHCTRCAVFPSPQLCFSRVMSCACDHTPNIISTASSFNYFGLFFIVGNSGEISYIVNTRERDVGLDRYSGGTCGNYTALSDQVGISSNSLMYVITLLHMVYLHLWKTF